MDKITNSFNSSKCEEVFPTKQEPTVHCTTHTTDKEFLCKECGNVFANVRNLEIHMKTHNDD